jgi:N4-gp56 family major capsid protein
VGFDLKSETGDGSWTAASQYSEVMRIWNDEIGLFANVRFIESPRARLQADAGTANVDVYSTYFFGRDYLAKAESIPPHMVLGPVTDKLNRFQPLGWHAYVGWDTFREAAIRIVKSASTIGSN